MSKEHYEWVPYGPQREEEALSLQADAEILLEIGLQIECAECRRRLIETSNRYKEWAGELLDRRRRMIPIIPRKRFQLKPVRSANEDFEANHPMPHRDTKEPPKPQG